MYVDHKNLNRNPASTLQRCRRHHVKRAFSPVGFVQLSLPRGKTSLQLVTLLDIRGKWQLQQCQMGHNQLLWLPLARCRPHRWRRSYGPDVRRMDLCNGVFDWSLGVWIRRHHRSGATLASARRILHAKYPLGTPASAGCSNLFSQAAHKGGRPRRTPARRHESRPLRLRANHRPPIQPHG